MTETVHGATLPLVFSQVNDVVMMQKQLTNGLLCEMQSLRSSIIKQEDVDQLQQELEEERRKHEETKALLADQSEKLQFALGEIEILTTQLNREKALFEASFGRISERAKKESSRNQQLETECTSIKAEREKQEELLAFKDAKIADLKRRLANQRESHQRNLEEVNIQMQQEAYISRNVATTSKRGKSSNSLR